MAIKRTERGIYKRGEIYWIQYSDGSGKTREESTKTKSITLAREILKAKRSQAFYDDLPEQLKTKDATFAQLAEKYIEATKTQKSYAVKKYYIAGLVEILGNTKIKQLTTDRVTALKKHLEETPTKDGTKRTGATVNRWMACYKHMITLANTDFSMCGRHTVEVTQRVKKEKENPHRQYWLSEEECARLIKASPPHIRPIIIMAIHTGLRRGNIYNLEWKNVNFVSKTCFLPDTKTNKSQTIPMTAGIELLLENLPRQGELVFYNDKGKPFKENGDIRKSFAKARKIAGLPDHFQLRDLRHTFATNLSINGEGIHRISILLGHSKIEMTKIYVNDDIRQGHIAVSTMDKIVPIDPELIPMATIPANDQYIGSGI